MSVTKEERRQQLARKKRTRVKLAKGAIVALAAVVTPVLAYLAMQG